jgi:secreted PhoX family phosphatase
MVIDDRRLARDRTGAADTRSGVLSLLNKPLAVRWVRIDDVDPASDTVRHEAHSKGAAYFARGEGACVANGMIYFVCTSGGDTANGQVWAHDPAAGTVTLVVESVAESELDNPDNITVSPDGSLYLCEDGAGEQYVVGVTRDGGLVKFARNSIVRPDRGGAAYNAEFAGACFSPNGRHMFLNNQGIGITFCIWGPWSRLG